MYRFSYTVLTVCVLVLTASPVFVFASLKYHGLEDDYTVAVDEEEDVASACNVVLKFGNFQHVFPSASGCAAMVCSAGSCGVKVQEGDTSTEYADTEALARMTEAEFERHHQTDESSQASDAGSDAPEETVWQSKYRYPLWQWASIFSTAVTFSLLGLSTSIVSRSGISIGGAVFDDLKGFSIIYFMACASGIVLVSLFAGGFLQGNLFPNFTGDELNFGFNSWSALKFRGQDWFKLAVWCYIAGFYERFLPGVLDRVMREVEEKDESAA